MDGKAAIKKYKEYAEKYESKNVGIYSSDYYELTGKGLMTEDYLRRCLDMYCVPEERKEEIITKWNYDFKNRPCRY